MRIISGSLGGRRLKTVEGEGYRPAMGRTREALFSMLEARGIDWEKTSALDLYAGSGSLAFEAISRGAARVVLVENSRQAVDCLEDNRRALGLENRAWLVREDVGRFLRKGADARYGLVFIDPPYGRRLTPPAMLFLLRHGWLAPGALVAAEVEKAATFEAPEPLERLAARNFGNTVLNIWRLS